ncbi:MAG TPA: prephenate dehydratase domain-containing protein [Clostridia bacterium]|nr:prephenate dehydratase domain-containing protein [Clostridia bacterium]
MDDYRKEINKIDDELLELFQKRMRIAEGIAEYKKANNIPILNSSVERAKLADLSSKADVDMVFYSRILFNTLFEMSRSYQEKLNHPKSVLMQKIENAIDNTNKLFPSAGNIACQGVEGAYSQLACDRMFSSPNIMYFTTFEGVFSAIDKNLCKYGILPLENSTAGSVNKVYDLMMKYKFNIIRSVRLKIDHNLLVKKGVKIKDIKEIYSHEQAISQCSEFIKSLGPVKINVVENTAIAAMLVSTSDRTDIAALSSRPCAELYGLNCISQSVQDKGNNYTKFICISKDIEIYPGADKTSIMMVLPHKPGSLYKVLSRFYVLGINLIKLESRPIPDRDFEFMFYFDIETPVYSEQFTMLINELDEMSEDFRYLGSYLEII